MPDVPQPPALDAQTLEAMKVSAPKLHNGTFTASHPKHGHFTVKVHTAQRGEHAGRRLLSLLIGPDNTADYRAVAAWDDEKEYARVFDRFVGPRSIQPVDAWHYQLGGGWSVYEQKLAIMLDLALRPDSSHWRASGYQLQQASRCCVCNRELTHPDSLRLGIGPECVKRGTP